MLRFVVLAAALCAGVSANTGNPAEISWAPWSAQIVNRDGAATCVGSIVNKETILTAASCFPEGENPSQAKYVVAGATNWNNGGQVHTIASVARFPGQDLAVVRLSSTIDFNNNVKSIDVASKKVKDNTHVLSAGWCADKGEPALRKVVMSSVPASFCNVANGQICTKIEKGQTCEGDIGSGVWTVPVAGVAASVGLPGKAPVPAELLGLLVRGSAEANTPAFVDLTDKAVRDFLIGEKVVKKGWFF